MTPEMQAAVNAAVAEAIKAMKPTRKAKGAKPGRTKLTDEQKAANAKTNAIEAEALFATKGYINNVAHDTIRTYDKWIEAGRRVRKGEKSLKTKKGVALFHVSQTSEIGEATKH